MFGNLTTNDSIQEDRDVLGGGGPLDSGIYDFTIDMAYVDKSKGGAMSINFTFKTRDGKEMRITEWISSGDKKGNKNYYETANGERRYLPGFNNVNAICKMTLNKDLAELEPENKTIKVWDWDQRKEVNQEKPVIMDLIGQTISLGVLQNIEDISQQDATGEYKPTGYTRMVNTVDKIFHSDTHLTMAEITAGASQAAFYDKWKDKNSGVTRDRSAASKGHIPKPKDGAAPATPAAKTDNTVSLFS